MLDLRDLQTLQVSQEAQLMRRYDDSPGNQDIMNAVMKHMLYGDSCHDLIPRQRVREPRGHAASSRRQLPGNRNDDRPRTPYQKRSKAQDESPSTFSCGKSSCLHVYLQICWTPFLMGVISFYRGSHDEGIVFCASAKLWASLRVRQILSTMLPASSESACCLPWQRC